MTTKEIQEFLESFEDSRARNLVRNMMEDNYTEAILANHPQPDVLDPESISTKCRNLCSKIFDSIDEAKDDPSRISELLIALSRNNPNQDEMWFEEFNEAYVNYKHHNKLTIKLEQLQPYLKGASYCDIGCGGGDLVAHIKRNIDRFKNVAGIDILDWRTEQIKAEINFQQLDFSKPNVQSAEQYDALTCLAVLHHVGKDQDSRIRFLQNLQSAMTNDGVLVVEEDAMIPKHEWQSVQVLKTQVESHKARQPHFAEFVSLDRQSQKNAIILIDLLSNTLSVGVPDMPFPFGFQTIQEWEDLFRLAGFDIEHVKIHGFKEGTFNRSSHVLFVLRKAS